MDFPREISSPEQKMNEAPLNILVFISPVTGRPHCARIYVAATAFKSVVLPPELAPLIKVN